MAFSCFALTPAGMPAVYCARKFHGFLGSAFCVQWIAGIPAGVSAKREKANAAQTVHSRFQPGRKHPMP